jgi:chemotaxis-related protein WspD
MTKKENDIRTILQNYRNTKELISANSLLAREPDNSYITEWTNLLAGESNPKDTAETSIVVFRIGDEWLALSTYICKQVADRRHIHPIPHRGGKYLLGMVNLQGQLTLCVALNLLLEINAPDMAGKTTKELADKRFLAIQKDNETWVFPVSEIFGVLHTDLAKIENVPVTVSKSTANYLKGVIPWDHKNVSLLDEELLFYSLRRSLQ